MAKMYDSKEKAVDVRATYEDFEGDLAKWKDSFYQLWRYQLTWDFAYKFELREYREKGVFVALLIKPAYKESLLETMEELGYRKVEANDVFVGITDAYHDELNDIEEIFMEW